jgi:anti-sigma factor RsiW
MKMSHVDEGTLQTFLDGELGETERREVDLHLNTCQACRVRLEEVGSASRRASELLGELEPGPVQAPSWRDLEERAEARAGGRPPRRWPRPALAWAASLLLAFAVGWWFRSFWGPFPDPVRVAAVEREESTPSAEGAVRAEPELGESEAVKIETVGARARETETAGLEIAEPETAGPVTAEPVTAEPVSGESVTAEAEIRAPGPPGEAEPSALAPAAESGRPVPSQAGAEPAEEASRAEPDTVALQPTAEKLRQIEADEAPVRLTKEVASAEQAEISARVRALPEGALRDAEAAGSPPARSSALELHDAGSAGRRDQIFPIQPEEAPRWLGGELRTLPDLRLQRAEVLPGEAVEGGLADRAAVRLVYADAGGHEVMLVQQPVGAAAEAGADTGPALVVEPNGRKTYRWYDAGYLLLLQGEVSSDSLRALAEQVR